MAGVRNTGLDLSIVVPFHNAEKYIERCIAALLAQRYSASRYEIIMVDNNSTDHSSEIVKKYRRVILVSEKKQGAYAARNRGVAASSGAIVAFTDSDCMPCPDWLQAIAAAMESPQVMLVQGRRLYGPGSSALALLEAYDAERAIFTFSGNAKGIYYGYTNNMAVRREVFDRCGPFLEIARGADSLFVQRVIAENSCENVRFSSNARIRHLELTSVLHWMRKRFIYGRSFERNYSRRQETFRHLTPAESSAIFKGSIQRSSDSFVATVHLMALLLIGRALYMLGRFSAKVTPPSESYT